MIDAGVEDLPLITSSAFYRNSIQQRAPRVARLLMNMLKVPIRNFLLQICPCTRLTHE